MGRRHFKGMAQKMDFAPLQRAAQHLDCGALQPRVCIGDHQLHPAEPASAERSEEIRPERLRLRRTDLSQAPTDWESIPNWHNG